MTNTSNLFGSEDKYKSLVCIHSYYTKLNRKDQKYLSSMFNDLNRVALKLSNIDDDEIFNYLISSIRKDFIDKNKAFYERISYCGYNENFTIFSNHIQNFITGKIRNLIDKRQQNKIIKKKK